MASPDLIKNAARWLAGYFSLIDVSEAWITTQNQSFIVNTCVLYVTFQIVKGRRGCDHMVVVTTYAISAYHH